MLCNDMSQICVPLQKFFQKQPKTTKKPYLYHTGIDMVWAKMSRASLKHHPPQELDFCPKLETQYRPCMCYIFEKPWVQGPQRQCSRVSDMQIQIHKYKYTNTNTNTVSVKIDNRPNICYIFGMVRVSSWYYHHPIIFILSSSYHHPITIPSSSYHHPVIIILSATYYHPIIILSSSYY